MEKIKKEIKDIKEEVHQDSLALEFVKHYKRVAKTMFIIWIITFVAFLCLVVYTGYLLNDIGVEETTTTTETYEQDIDDTGDINSSNINNGGVINGKN